MRAKRNFHQTLIMMENPGFCMMNTEINITPKQMTMYWKSYTLDINYVTIVKDNFAKHGKVWLAGGNGKR